MLLFFYVAALNRLLNKLAPNNSSFSAVQKGLKKNKSYVKDNFTMRVNREKLCEHFVQWLDF